MASEREEFKDKMDNVVVGLNDGREQSLLNNHNDLFKAHRKKAGKKTILTSDINISSLDSEIGEFVGAMKSVTKVNTNHGVRALKSYSYPEMDIELVMKDLVVQQISFFVSLDFNKELTNVGLSPIDVRWPAYTFRKQKMNNIDTFHDGDNYYYGIELWIEGEWTKYNLNTGEIYNDTPPIPSEIVQAFTHYSLLYSGGSFMICDIQGCGTTLCDCQIASLDGGKTLFDIGGIAMEVFMAQHTCGETCRRLHLPSFKEVGSIRSNLDLSAFRRDRGMDRNQKASEMAGKEGLTKDQSVEFYNLMMNSKVPRRVRDSLTLARSRRENIYRRAGKTPTNQNPGSSLPPPPPPSSYSSSMGRPPRYPLPIINEEEEEGEKKVEEKNNGEEMKIINIYLPMQNRGNNSSSSLSSSSSSSRKKSPKKKSWKQFFFGSV